MNFWLLEIASCWTPMQPYYSPVVTAVVECSSLLHDDRFFRID
jgi:hypothetical protein